MSNITREQFNEAVEALWAEIEYQNALTRRTLTSEAKDVQGFATLGRVYLRQLESDWALNEGDELALNTLRKVAGIFVRGMIVCGVRKRGGRPGGSSR
jgi:hypothetical protein